MTDIKLKKSSVSGRVPSGADLTYGEIAINYEDGKIYYKDASNVIRAFLDSANIVSQIDIHSFDSAEVAQIMQAYTDSAVFLTSTQTLTNKTLTTPTIGDNFLLDSTTVYGQQYGGFSVNEDIQHGDSTQTMFRFAAQDSTTAVGIGLSVPNQITSTLAMIGDADSSVVHLIIPNDNSSFRIGRDGGSGPVVFEGDTFTGDTIVQFDGTGQTHFPYDAEAASKTSAAVTILGGLGVDKNIRGQDIIASGNLQANGNIVGNVLGTVNSISNHDTNDLSEGSTNLYYTTTRFDSDFDSATTDRLTEGSSNLYYTAARADSDARHGISVLDNGGDGALVYDNATGIITYTGPSPSEVRSHFSGGTGVTYNSGTGEFSIGQSVGTGDSVDFAAVTTSGNIVINGNLTVLGTQTVSAQENLSVTNAYIKLADSNTADTVDIGLVGRYSDDGGTTIRRAGFIRDATTGEWHVFSGLVQDGIDSSSPDQVININDSTVEYPIWNFGGLRGQYLGFDSDFRAFSTDYTIIDSDYQASPADRLGIDTTNNSLTITLPANPTTGDYIRLLDVGDWSNNSVFLGRNGSLIEGYADDFELDLGQNIIEVIYLNNKWQVYSAIGQRGPAGQDGQDADSADFATPAQSIAYAIALG